MDPQGLTGAANDVPQLYADLDGLRMTVITGSVARGLADSASDLDVYLYWDGVDRDALALNRRLEAIGARRIVGLPTANGFFEKYRLGGRFIDVESVDVDALEQAVRALTGDEPVDDGVISLAAGLRDAQPITGADELSRWQGRLTYSEVQARAQVAARSHRLLSPRALFEITFERGDALSFAARLSRVLLDGVALLGAANRAFIPVDEPKWLPWHIDRLPSVPPRLVERIHEGLTRPSSAVMDDLHQLLLDVLDMVDERVPGADTKPGRFVLGLRPDPSAADR